MYNVQNYPNSYHQYYRLILHDQQQCLVHAHHNSIHRQKKRSTKCKTFTSHKIIYVGFLLITIMIFVVDFGLILTFFRLRGYEKLQFPPVAIQVLARFESKSMSIFMVVSYSMMIFLSCKYGMNYFLRKEIK